MRYDDGFIGKYGYQRVEGVFFLHPRGHHSPRRVDFLDPGISSSK